MATSSEGPVGPEEFKLMADRAGLGLSDRELEELKPMYDLYRDYINLLHSIEFQAEEVGVTFHPDWAPQ